jgi:hypothetical protein
MKRISRGSRGRLLRFRKDVEAIAGLVHPNLTRIHASGESTGRDYLEHVAQKPPLPGELNPAVPPVVERMILRLIDVR